MKKTAKPQVLGPDELSVFCYELSLMVQAGIGSEESVGILAQDARSPREKELLERMHAVLLEGRALSAALEETGVFPHYMLRMVEIGQASGRLDQVLSALSAYYRREADTQQSLRRPWRCSSRWFFWPWYPGYCPCSSRYSASWV